MRDPKLQQKAIDYALVKTKPILNKVGKEAFTELSTEIRPKRTDGKPLHKTDIKRLDYKDGGDIKEMGWGAGLDIHKAIGKLPHIRKRGFILPGHKYTGP